MSNNSYNALERRREASKGGKDTSKKSVPSQPSTKSAAPAAAKHAPHNARRSDAPHVNIASQAVSPLGLLQAEGLQSILKPNELHMNNRYFVHYENDFDLRILRLQGVMNMY